MSTLLRDAARRLLPPRLRATIVARQRRHGLVWPPRGGVSFGDLRRVTPVSAIFGLDRGQPIDRHYIERFLALHSADIRGRALELGDATYLRRFGGTRVDRIDVLHVAPGNPEATIVADLTNAPHIPDDTFDCVVFTQSIQMIYDMRAALATLHRILRPGGVLLMTAAGIAKIGRRLGRDDWGEYWRLTAQSAARLCAEAFPGGEVEVATHGNVLAATAFLHGIAAAELAPAELDYVDPDFEVIVAARVVKARAA
jgi:SAM-dependent methyltransferase